MIFKKIKYLLLLYAVVCCGQESNFRFDHFTTQFQTIEDGLSSNTVLCLLQDSKGFIWIGTYNGLNRYDGYSIKVFRNIEGDESSLSDDYIRSICEDKEGNLWVGTSEGGLNKFIREKEKFKRFKHDFNNQQSLSNDRVYSLAKDTSGNIWAGTAGGGLCLLDIHNEKFINYSHDPGNSSSISDNIIHSLLVDKNGTLWAGTQSGGLNKFESQKKQFISYQHKSGNTSTICSNYILSVYEDHSGYLWLGTNGGGLDKFDRTRNEFTHYLHDPDDESSLSSNTVWTIYEDRENKLWIGTFDAGINLFDRKHNQFIRIVNNFANSRGLNNNSIMSILEDNSGMLWFGTWSGGLNKYDKSKEIFKNYSHNPLNKNSLSNNEVYAIYVDASDELWAGSSSGGLDRLDRTGKKISNYKYDPENPFSLSSNSVNSITEDKEGYLWIGTDGGGLNRFNRSNQRFTHFNKDLQNLNSLRSNNISQTLCDRLGNLWIGVRGGGVDKYISSENKFIHYDEIVSDSLVNTQPMVYSFYEDHEGNIWAGTYGGGISIYDRMSDRFKNFRYDSHNQNTNIVSVILEVQDGNYWAGTSNGIIRFKRDNTGYRHYTEKDGLINNLVNGMVEDKDGFLWISTMKGISRFDIKNERFTNYDAANGLQGTEFNTWAYCKGPDGRIYFGGVNGITAFYPQEIMDNPHIPDIAITNFRLMHKPVAIGFDSSWGRAVLENSITETNRIELNYDDNIISFEVAVLDYKNPRKNTFGYILEGFDKNWTYKRASERNITYTNLNPGKYIFKVKGANSDGLWNKKGISLTLIINHPWWKTWWAYSIYVILFGLVFTGSTRFYLNRKMLRNQLELEHEHAKKLADLDSLKSHFFTNISHEFRTPLTLIMGPSSNIIDHSSDPGIINQAKTINRNANRLMRLINQLLDLSKLDEQKLKLHATESNIVSFIKGVVMSFEGFAEKKDLDLKVKASRNEIVMFFDQDKMDKIITNLLSNAIKFTPGGGKIKVEINEKNEDCIEIKVSDNGIGIPETELPKLFDRFYQVDTSQTRQYEGSGLGLSLTKELIELHHGTVKVKSEVSSPRNGKRGYTEFLIELPKGRFHYNDDEIISTPEITGQEEISESDEKIYTSAVPDTVADSDTLRQDKTIVLIVEDNIEVREYIREFLIEEYCVEEAMNGEQGIRKAERIIPDLIISDIMMPKIDGNQLTRILKNEEKTSHIPIILLTAKSEYESKIEGLEAGADDYLTKPFEPDELKIRVKNLIQTRRKLQEKYRNGEDTFKRVEQHLGTLDKNFLNKINVVIEKHLHEEEFSIEALGKEVNMSRSQIHRKLTALTGKSPSLYMRSARLTKAKQMILEQTGNISEIAYSVGFSSPAYFTRCFKEEFGVPPSEIINRTFN